MEIINLNGVEYIRREKIADIEKERDDAVKDLNAMKEILGKSFKDLASFIDLKTQNKEELNQNNQNRSQKIIRKPEDAFEPVQTAKRLFKIRYMNSDGVFFTENNRPLKVTIKHVFEVQKALHNNVTNGEIDELAKKLGINYQILHRVVFNYQEHAFDKFINQWNKQTQPTVGARNKPIENNPEKRKESGLYA